MGLDINTTRLILIAKRHGVDFTRTITLGRQWLQVDSQTLRGVLREMQVDIGADQRGVEATAPFADGLLSMLGARTLASVDASAYEGASIIHDMNQDLPRELDGKFTLVIDAGTLEHIFDFPTAIRNCMRLLEVGGHLVIATPANNFMGHGFYQFSPELFYRVLSPENGFRVVRMYICEVRRCGPWYELTDPAELKRRVELVNSVPTYLLVLAEKVSEAALLRSPPQQSDYAQGSWQSSAGRPVKPRQKRRLRALVRKMTPCWLTNLKAAISRGIRSPYRATYFKRTDWRAPEDSAR